MFEQYRQILEKISNNTQLITQLEEENKTLQRELISLANCLIGRCYSQPRSVRGHWNVVTKQDPYGEWIDKLDNVIQIIGIHDTSFIIQEAKEVIREVSPKERLTWENSIYAYDIEKFIAYNRSEITLGEYLERIKKMQERDSYVYWKTSIEIHA